MFSRNSNTISKQGQRFNKNRKNKSNFNFPIGWDNWSSQQQQDFINKK